MIPILWLVSGITYAQDRSDNQWKFLVEPYIMFPFMNGSTGIGNLPDVSVDASASDIFSNLSIGAMLYAEAYTPTWAIGSDIIYINLKEYVKTGVLITAGSVQAKQFAWEVSGLRRLSPWLEVGIGGRLNSLSADIDLTISRPNETNTRSGGTTETWFDPILIARVKNPSGEKFLYQFRGDLGGLGIGSQFTYQIQAYVGYRFSDLFQMTAGYRLISIDYEKGANENRFLYDVDTSGPVIRFGFNL